MKQIEAEELSISLSSLVVELQETINAFSETVRGDVEKSGVTAVDATDRIVNLVGILSVLVMAVALLMVFVYVRPFIVQRLDEVYRATNHLADGKVNIDLPKPSSDEIGQIALALKTFRDNLVRSKELEEKQKETAAQKEREEREMREQLADKFETEVGAAIKHVTSSVKMVTDMAERMSSMLQETSSSGAEASDASKGA